jgi:hypothetical protein
MLQPIFTSLRRLFVPRFMRDIDQYLLTHHAWVWETRVHWFTLYATALMLLLVGAGCCAPISFPDDITLFQTIENGLAMVQASVVCIVGLFFLLLVNGLFARFFKTGFIANNQKFRPIDFLKLGGVYGFMLVFAALACSAYHYTLIVRTHFIINQAENYALLDKYAKIHEFYRQDTLRIKGFEQVEQYLDKTKLGYSQIELSHIYSKIPYEPDTVFTDPRILSYNTNSIDYLPVNQALYRILPKDITLYKLEKNSFEPVEIYIKNHYSSVNEIIEGKSEAEIMALIDEYGYNNQTKIPLVQKSDIMNNISSGTCGFEMRALDQDLEQYCRFTHYSIPHTYLSGSSKKVLLDQDTVSIDIVEKSIDNNYYENHNNYWRFGAKQLLGILLVTVFFAVLFLSLHAYQSFRFFTLIPVAMVCAMIMIEEFINRNYGSKDHVVVSMAIFYLVFAVATLFWHRKVYTTNPLKFAIIYSVSTIICSIPLMRIVPYFFPKEHSLTATQIISAHNFIVPTLLIVHILLYLILFLGRNTRLVITTPFLYFFAFFWLFIPNIIGIYSYHNNESTVEPNFFVQILQSAPYACIPFFLLLNLLTAPFLLSAIVRQTRQPK